MVFNKDLTQRLPGRNQLNVPLHSVQAFPRRIGPQSVFLISFIISYFVVERRHLLLIICSSLRGLMNSHPWQRASVTAGAEIRARRSCGSVSVPRNQSACERLESLRRSRVRASMPTWFHFSEPPTARKISFSSRK